MADDLFATIAAPVIDPEKDYSAELIGEGKKYVDQKAAARALLEKDAFIESLKRETSELRADNATRMKMEEFVDKLNSTRQTEPVAATPAATPPVKSETTEDVNKIVEQQLQAREAANTAKRNLLDVKGTLESKLGPNYAAEVEARAAKLGLGKDFLNTLAASQPKAFYAIMGLDQAPAKQELFTPPPQTQMNTASFTTNTTGEKTEKFYLALMKSDKQKYLSQAVQLEIHKQAMKLGPAFYDAS